MDIKETEDKYSTGVYSKRDLVIVRGKGAKVWDINNKEYVDCIGGVGTQNTGHCNEYVVNALKEQSQTLISCVEIFYNDKRAALMEKLVEISPKGLNHVFLCNSGTESIEGAIKFARGSTGKKEIISALRGFHGRTFGSLSATWKKKYQEPFEPLVPGFKSVRYNDFEDLKEKITDNTAAVILEIVQGEGGIYLGNKDYFLKVRELCDEKNTLLIIDEIQTGFGRTGKMFACEHFSLNPDIMCLAKSLAGGVPMGAVLLNEKSIKIPKRSHGATFGGNPLACAAALANIKFIEENKLWEKSEELGKYFISKLKNIKSDRIREIRGLGLMVAIELKEKVGPYLKKLADEGVLANIATDTALRFLPPLIISKEEIDFVVEKVDKVLR